MRKVKVIVSKYFDLKTQNILSNKINTIPKNNVMKKIFMMLIVILASIGHAYGYDFVYNNLKYTILSAEDKTVSVAGYSSTTTGNLVIPQRVSNNAIIYTVTEIGSYAFDGCTGLTSVTIPSSVTSIGWYAFDGCIGLKKVNISSIAAWCGICFSSENANPLFYARHLYMNDEELTDLVIPSEITKVNDYAFDGCTGLKAITIPSSVTSIGDGAFEDCCRLTSITIPSSVTSIGRLAFSGCSDCA